MPQPGDTRESAPLTLPRATPEARERFDLARLRRLEEIEPVHFWFAARGRLIDSLLRQHCREGGRVLEIGSGAGGLLRRRRGPSPRFIALDIHFSAVAGLRARYGGAPGIQADAEHLPFKEASLDAVLAFDVLEHMDDQAALREAARTLRPGGRLVVSVPALPVLWSYRDEAAGHKRRYTRKSLISAVEAAGLSIAEVRAYQVVLLPLLVATRLLGRGGPRLRDREDEPGRLPNVVLGWINSTEVRLGLGRVAPWGSSLLAAAVAPAR